MSRIYELMLLVSSDSSESDQKKLTDSILAGLTKDAVKDVSFWGKKTLAYPIDKKTSANYWLAHLKLSSLSISTIKLKMNQNSSILRYLITSTE